MKNRYFLVINKAIFCKFLLWIIFKFAVLFNHKLLILKIKISYLIK